MTNWKSVRIGCVAGALAFMMAGSVMALGNHENTLTFSSPVALPGVVLPAGSYSFDVASPTALDVVVVRHARSGKTLYMGFTRTVTRPRAMSKNAPIAFGEATANQPRPIAAWYEIGEDLGHEFLYR